jgi:Tetratricopeptide repeat/Protein of unknown function (DUF2914)
MLQPTDAGEILEAAERAAAAGDLAAAGELLRNAAHLQETTLGPLHPDLASTLNNLAIVSEKTGRQDDAEKLYRRATAIASRSLPADHPMVTESRQNLEDFCRSYGLPIDPTPVATTSPPKMTSLPDSQPSRASAAAGSAKTSPAGPAVPPVLHRPNSLRRGAIGVTLLVMAVLMATRWTSREGSAPSSESAAKAPAASRTPSTAPIEEQPPKAIPQGHGRGVVNDRPSTPAASAPITLATAELCETFSTREDDWQCKRAGGSVAPGRIVMYTRVKSSRDNILVHRWFLDNALQQSVRLMTRANETAGYRTFSRQSVGPGQHWRVEVLNAEGGLLHEQRFSVR